MLCRRCEGKCSGAPTEQTPVDLACAQCGGKGCERCGNGYWQLKQCPRRYVGHRMSSELEMVTHAIRDKLLPDAGGINDQPARFVNLWRAFQADIAYIEREEAKRAKRH